MRSNYKLQPSSDGRKCIRCECSLVEQPYSLVEYQYRRNGRWQDSGHGVCDLCSGKVYKFRYRLWLGERIGEE